MCTVQAPQQTISVAMTFWHGSMTASRPAMAKLRNSAQVELLDSFKIKLSFSVFILFGGFLASGCVVWEGRGVGMGSCVQNIFSGICGKTIFCVICDGDVVMDKVMVMIKVS